MCKLILSLWLATVWLSTAQVGGQISGTIELNLVREGTQWRADAKFFADDRRPSDTLRDVRVVGNDIAFSTTLLQAQLRFSGSLSNGNVNGTIEGFQGGSRVATGTWSMSRAEPTTETGLAGRWVGNFIIQPGDPPQAMPPAVDQSFSTQVARPAYPGKHPKVLFDEAHNNADTSSGRYKPFAELITSDGYRILANTQKLSKSTLGKVDVLVIVNASGPYENRSSPAFGREECEALREWVNEGGAALLITDHPPFSDAVEGLVRVFGVELTKGHTIDPSHHNEEADDPTELVFKRDEGLIVDHPITRGRDASERINRVITFTGTSVKGPVGSVPFLKLADTALDVLPPAHKPSAPDEPAGEYTQSPAAGRAQGIALSSGRGRVVVLSEAAMLTAQVAPRGFRFGMNLPGIDNRQLALNIMHWLSGLLK